MTTKSKMQKISAFYGLKKTKTLDFAVQIKKNIKKEKRNWFYGRLLIINANKAPIMTIAMIMAIDIGRKYRSAIDWAVAGATVEVGWVSMTSKAVS
jgi:hypothetical protein